MIVKQLAEIIFKFANAGRPKITAQTVSKTDITQMVYVSFGAILRNNYEQSRKLSEDGRPDFSPVSPILGTIEFSLSKPNTIGMRRADMSAYDLYRLPNDSHITNIYPIAGDCGSKEIGKISLVEPGEERFYLSPEYNFFIFGVVKGRGVNIYHLPLCVNKVGIESTYNSSEVDVSLEIAEEIALHVLGTTLKIPSFSNKVVDNSYVPPQQVELRNQLRRSQTAENE